MTGSIPGQDFGGTDEEQENGILDLKEFKYRK